MVPGIVVELVVSLQYTASPALPAAFVPVLPVSVVLVPASAAVAIHLVPGVISPDEVWSLPDAALLALFLPLHIAHDALAPGTLILPDISEAPAIELCVQLVACYTVESQKMWEVDLNDFLYCEEHFDYGWHKDQGQFSLGLLCSNTGYPPSSCTWAKSNPQAPRTC
jgi:hypothetical protein